MVSSELDQSTLKYKNMVALWLVAAGTAATVAGRLHSVPAYYPGTDGGVANRLQQPLSLLPLTGKQGQYDCYSSCQLVVFCRAELEVLFVRIDSQIRSDALVD